MHDEYVFKVYVILFSMRNNHYHSHVPVDKWLMLNKLHNNYMHKLNGDKVGTMPSQKTWNALIWVSCLHWCIICMFVWWMQPQNSLFHLYLFRSLSLCLCLRAFVNIDVCVSLWNRMSNFMRGSKIGIFLCIFIHVWLCVHSNKRQDNIMNNGFNHTYSILLWSSLIHISVLCY